VALAPLLSRSRAGIASCGALLATTLAAPLAGLDVGAQHLLASALLTGAFARFSWWTVRSTSLPASGTPPIEATA